MLKPNRFLVGITLVISSMLVFVTSVQGKNLSAWLYGNDSTFGTRIGYATTDKTEVGLESVWFRADEGDVPQVWGAYGIFKPTDPIQFPNPLPFEWLPKTLNGTPYMGVQVGVDVATKGTFVGPIAGIIFEDILFIEYQYVSADFNLQPVDDSQKVVIGLRFKF